MNNNIVQSVSNEDIMLAINGVGTKLDTLETNINSLEQRVSKLEQQPQRGGLIESILVGGLMFGPNGSKGAMMSSFL